MIEGEGLIQPYVHLPKDKVIDSMVENVIEKPFLKEIQRMDELETKLTNLSNFYQKLNDILNSGTEVVNVKDNGFEVRKLRQGTIPEVDMFRCTPIKTPEGVQREVKFDLALFIGAIEGHIRAIEKLKMSIVSNYNYQCKEEDILNLATAYEDILRRKDVEAANIEGIMNKIDADIERITSQLVAANIEANTAYVDAVNASNEDFVNLESKRQELLAYSDKVIATCAEWGITPSDIDIDNETFTIEQLYSLYENYLVEMQKEENRRNPIALLRRLLPSVYAQFGVVVILMVICFSPILNIASIGFFAWLIVAQMNNRNKVDFYTVLEGILFNVNPLNLGGSTVDERKLLPETISDEDMDTMPEFDGVRNTIAELERRTSHLEDIALTHDLMPLYEIARKDIIKTVNNNNKSYLGKRDTMIADCDNAIINFNNLKESAITAYVPFYERYSEDIVFDSKFIFGVKDKVFEESIDIGSEEREVTISKQTIGIKDLKNIIIRPGTDKRLLKVFIRTLLVNAFVNVHPGNIEFDIYDPNDGSQMIVPFYTQSMQSMFRMHREGFNKILEDLRKVVDTNFKLFRGRSIVEYNLAAKMEGLTPIKYRVLLVLSQPKDIEENEALLSFFEHSAQYGVYCWVVSDNLSSTSAHTFSRPFARIMNPAMDLDSDDLCRKIGNTYGAKVEKGNVNTGLMWLDFLSNTFDTEGKDNGKRKFWSGSANEFIDFYPGYHNGDKNLTTIYRVGNEGDIHALGVGGTGAGKSVFLNHIVATITWLYSPFQVELWMADFKGVEFGYYIGQDLWKGKFYNMNFTKDPLPHISACLCTADPTFGSSLFGALADLSRQRYNDMQDIGVKNLPGWNDNVIPGELKPSKLVTSHSDDPTYSEIWQEEDEWKRILVIVDEFQVIFEKAKEGGEAANLVEKIKVDLTYISKVSRACGVHLFFTSQSMNGTLSADILNQFSLRFGLRCAKDVSMDVMGGETSSSITDKNGFLYVRDLTSVAPDKQKKFKTPFIESDTFGPISKMPKKKVALALSKKGIDPTDVPANVKLQKDELEKVVREDIIYARILTYGTDEYKYFMKPPKDDHYRKSLWSPKKVEFEERLSKYYKLVDGTIDEVVYTEEEDKPSSMNDGKIPDPELTAKAKEIWDKLDLEVQMEIMEVAPLRAHITRCSREAKKRGFKRPKPVTYQESSICTIDELDEFYAKGRELGNLPDSGVFFIGERMFYSDANAPYNFVLGRENNTHIAAAFNSITDISNFFKCLCRNIELNKVPGKIILNSQDKDLPYLLRWDEKDLGGFEQLCNYSCHQMVNWIEKLFKARESGQNKSLEPIWIFLMGWDKGKGFVIEKDLTLVMRLNNIVALCGIFNIHIIMINSTGGCTDGHLKGMGYRILGNVDKDTAMSYHQSYTAAKLGGPKDGWCYVKDMVGQYNRSKIFLSPIDKERKPQVKDIRF